MRETQICTFNQRKAFEIKAPFAINLPSCQRIDCLKKAGWRQIFGPPLSEKINFKGSFQHERHQP